jgi:hypothetical protein
MKKRTGGRVTINWTCSVHAKPFVNAASMETVCTIRNASDYVLDVVLWEVYWATSDSSIPSSVLEVLLVMAGSVDTVLPRLNLFKHPIPIAHIIAIPIIENMMILYPCFEWPENEKVLSIEDWVIVNKYVNICQNIRRIEVTCGKIQLLPVSLIEKQWTWSLFLLSNLHISYCDSQYLQSGEDHVSSRSSLRLSKKNSW